MFYIIITVKKSQEMTKTNNVSVHYQSLKVPSLAVTLSPFIPTEEVNLSKQIMNIYFHT